VSWVHHMHWGIVVVGALLGDGRRPARVVAALVALGALLCRLPWWGVTVLVDGDLPRWFGRLLQNSYSVFAVLSIVMLWLLLVRRARTRVTAPSAAAGSSAVSGAHAPSGV